MNSRDAARPVVVFDLDDTLVTGDAFAAFLRHLITGRRLRYAFALISAPAWLPALLVAPTRLSAERWLIWLAGAGMDREAFAAAARDFAQRYASAQAGRVAVPALARTRQHIAAGHRVLVATGCAAPLAQQVCAMIGLGEIEVVASTRVRRRWGPPRHVVPARGAAKVAALEAAGIALPLEHAYSDSASDLPLLQAARTAHLVDPTARDLARLRRAFGEDVEVLRWARR